MSPDPNKDPKQVILPTSHLLQTLRERLVGLDQTDYNLSEIAGHTIQALAYPNFLAENLEKMLKYFEDQYVNPLDQQLIREAIREFFLSVEFLVDRLLLRGEDGVLGFLFHNWHGQDMVIAKFPY